jgi:hypothetical protein
MKSYASLCNDSTSYYVGTSGPALFLDAIPVSLDHKIRVDTKLIESDAPQLVAFSDANIKYAKQNPNWEHIDEFFLKYEDGVLKSTKYTRPYFTSIVARQLELAPKFGYAWLRHSDLGARLFPKVSSTLSKVHGMVVLSSSNSNYYAENSEATEEYKNYECYLETLAEYAMTIDEVTTEMRQEKSRASFVVDVPEVDVYDKDVIEFLQGVDELGNGFNELFNGIHGASFRKSQESMDLLVDLLKLHNKYDVEIPDITVPEFSFTIKVNS